MHVGKRRQKITGTGISGKVAVMGLLERHGEACTKVVGDIGRETLQSDVKRNVASGAELFTDKHTGYQGLKSGYHDLGRASHCRMSCGRQGQLRT